MGFDANVEETLEGARGKHAVDVVVRTKLGGVPTTWIVECKYWKTSVPKAHVLTLVQIAQDVGADRAFLLSEKGFQAGAVAAVRRTNVSLTNVEELEATAADSIAEVSIRQSLTTVKGLEHDLQGLLERQLRAPSPSDPDETITLLGACLEVTMAATAALASRFPVHLPAMLSEEAPVRTNEPAVVAEALGRTVHEIEKRSATLKTALSAATSQAADDAEELISRVRELIARGDALLEQASNADAEDVKLRDALDAMRAVGRQRESLRGLPDVGLVRGVRALMRELFDGVYCWIGDPARTPAAWAHIKAATEAAISGLSGAISQPRL